MNFKNSGPMVQEYLYDFSVDGGAVGALILSNKATKEPLPVGSVLMAVTGHVLTTCTSGGSATVEWGNGDDADGYSGSAAAVASLTAGAIITGWTATTPSALLWDNTNDAQLYLYIDDATTGQFKMTINTAALTAGKIVFLCQYLLPSS